MGSVNKYRITPLIVSVIVTTTAIYLRDFTGTDINKYLYVLLILGIALVLDYSSLVYYLFFLVPLRSGLPGTYIFPLIITVLILKRPKYVSKRIIVAFAILVVLELWHYPFYEFEISWNHVVGTFSFFFLMLYLIGNAANHIRADKCLEFYCIGIAVFLIGIFVLTFIVGGTEYITGQVFRIGMTKDATSVDENMLMLNENPNGIAWFSLSGLTSALVLYRLKKIHVLLFSALLAIFVVVGALSVSRTWVICSLAMTLLYVVMGLSLDKKQAIAMIFGTLVVLGLIAIVLMHVDIVKEMFESRMTNDTMSSGGNRTQLFQIYNIYLLENPFELLLGTGAVHYFDVVSNSFVDGMRVENSIHNGIQQIYVSYGLLGFLFWILLVTLAIKSCYKKGCLICWLPFIISLMFVQSAQLINPPYLLFIFIAAFMSLRLSQGEKCMRIKEN